MAETSEPVAVVNIKKVRGPAVVDASLTATTRLLPDGLKAMACALSNLKAPFVGTYCDHDNYRGES